MKKPTQPTQEELTCVANYWHWVEESVRTQGFGDDPKPPQPTQKVLNKVARWKAWRALMTCQHSGGITFAASTAEMTCSDCGDQMRFLSETQIEEMRSEH